jgi:hypothetical protein
MRTSNGAGLMSRRLGFSRCMNGATFGSVDCADCGVTFHSQASLDRHQNGKNGQSQGFQDSFCLSYQEAAAAVKAGALDEEYVASRRNKRLASFRKSGRLAKDGAEPVEVMTCSGGAAKTCESFVYLGTMVSPDALPQGEIQRRAVRAWTIMGDLEHVWKSRCIKWKLKGEVFSALVLSVMLYNAEVWPLKKQDTALLERIYTRLTRSICLRHVRGQSVRQQDKLHHIKKVDVLKLLQLPTMTALLRQKRMRWVGHAMRRDDNDYSKLGVKKELALRSNIWTKCVLGDMKELGIQSLQKLETISLKRANFRKITSAHTQI